MPTSTLLPVIVTAALAQHTQPACMQNVINEARSFLLVSAPAVALACKRLVRSASNIRSTSRQATVGVHSYNSLCRLQDELQHVPTSTPLPLVVPAAQAQHTLPASRISPISDSNRQAAQALIGFFSTGVQ
jgi:hypothetical protein